QCCLSRPYLRSFARCNCRRIASREQPGCNGFGISLDARNLTRKKDSLIAFQLQRRPQQSRGVDVRISMHQAETQKLGILQSRNESEHARLLSISHMILKTNQVVA